MKAAGPLPGNPTPATIRALRVDAGLSPTEAARLVHLGSNSRWCEYENGRRRPDRARLELFLLLTNQHPDYRLVRRRNGAKP